MNAKISVFLIFYYIICMAVPLKINYAKSVQIRNFFWSEYGKILTRKNSVFGHFSHINLSHQRRTFNLELTFSVFLFRFLFFRYLRLCNQTAIVLLF